MEGCSIYFELKFHILMNAVIVKAWCRVWFCSLEKLMEICQFIDSQWLMICDQSNSLFNRYGFITVSAKSKLKKYIDDFACGYAIAMMSHSPVLRVHFL
jgi:hypothetical protein